MVVAKPVESIRKIRLVVIGIETVSPASYIEMLIDVCFIIHVRLWLVRLNFDRL